MRRGDKLFAFLLLGLLLLAALLFFLPKNAAGGRVLVQRYGEPLAEHPLSDDALLEFEEAGALNRLRVEGGRVYMESANCRDQVCVRQGAVSDTGGVITCLPHGLTVRLEGAAPSELDAISQ